MMLKEPEVNETSDNDMAYHRNSTKDDDNDSFESQRVYKKTSPNSILTLYLGSREIISRCGIVEPLKGVIFVDPKFITGHRLYGQLTLIFRYGREDEEVMGLKFCNEAIIALKQIWPDINDVKGKDPLTPLQEALVERLGRGSYPFSIEIGSLAPPSVQLIPAKKYNGSPIGTSYDVRVYIADQSDDKIHRRSMVKLGVRLIHKISPYASQTPVPSIPRSLKFKMSPRKLKLINKFGKGDISQTCFEKSKYTSTNKGIENVTKEPQSQSKIVQGPQGSVDKPFLWTEGKVSLKASLNKSAYGHGEKLIISIEIKNDSRKIVRKIKTFAVQHVDVCMFSNGKFKNVVADIEFENQIAPGESLQKTFELLPVRGAIKNWIAIEGSILNYNEIMSVSTSKIASSAPRGPQTEDERNVFAIYVSYYVKIKLSLSGMGGEVSLKLPFVLGYVEDESEKLKEVIEEIDENIIVLGHIDHTLNKSIDVIAEENETQHSKNSDSRKSSNVSEQALVKAEIHSVICSES